MFLSLSCTSQYKEFDFKKNNAQTYLEAANYLQRLGEEKATEWLIQEQKKEYWPAVRVHVLCRMLYTSKNDKPFRSARIGGRFFIADSTFKDWPNEPITLIKDIPFVVTIGHVIGGHPEDFSKYLSELKKASTWRTEPIKMKSGWEVLDAFCVLLANKKFKRILTPGELVFLLNQVTQIDEESFYGSKI